MTSRPTPSPLQDDEFDYLAAYLETVGPPAMNIEMLDGFFCALICSPETVPPSEYLPEICGADPEFESYEEAQKFIGLLMRHWNTIASTLAREVDEAGIYFPVLLEDENGVERGNDWATGFLRGMQMRQFAWRSLLDDDERAGMLVPMMMLAHEHDPDPSMRPDPIAPEKRDEILQVMIASVTLIHRYFEPFRRVHVPMPRRRETAKVGRNDPCPCGSTKKYKHCCLAAGATRLN